MFVGNVQGWKCSREIVLGIFGGEIFEDFWSNVWGLSRRIYEGNPDSHAGFTSAAVMIYDTLVNTQTQNF